ncbi:MAG: ATP-binding cassette domain-containing protein [Rhodococcus sp.]|nr:ATP-binding cassette domain-containing protein [Rhodococcus sp. (in: high G+C Gram-positive bacteria)]
MVSRGLSLRAQVTARGFDVELDIEPWQVVAVLGPNGAGKSTLLSVLSGLIYPDHGHLVLDGKTLIDTAAHVQIPPHKRAVALLAQQPLLFPHLSVAANVAFAPRAAGASRRVARDAAYTWLEAVDALEFARRRPHQLSGGQAQRVAVARALAADPKVLLLDEPLAALDVSAAPAIRSLLRDVLRSGERMALVVTHDILDALAFADRAVVIESGHIAEEGPVREVLSRPRSDFGARIAGVNMMAGTANETGLTARDGVVVTGNVDTQCRIGGDAVAVFAPHAVAIYLSPPEGSPRNLFEVQVTELTTRGAVVVVAGALTSSPSTVLTAEITAAAAADLQLVPGAKVCFVVKATEVAVHASARQRAH